jgi:hypothetical protein
MQKGSDPLRDHSVLEAGWRHHHEHPTNELARAEVTRGEKIFGSCNVNGMCRGKPRRHRQPPSLRHIVRFLIVASPLQPRQ